MYSVDQVRDAAEKFVARGGKTRVIEGKEGEYKATTYEKGKMSVQDVDIKTFEVKVDRQYAYGVDYSTDSWAKFSIITPKTGDGGARQEAKDDDSWCIGVATYNFSGYEIGIKLQPYNDFKKRPKDGSLEYKLSIGIQVKSNEGDEYNGTTTVGNSLSFGYTHTASGKGFGYIIDFRVSETYKNGQRTDVFIHSHWFYHNEPYGRLGGNIRIRANFIPNP